MERLHDVAQGQPVLSRSLQSPCVSPAHQHPARQGEATVRDHLARCQGPNSEEDVC